MNENQPESNPSGAVFWPAVFAAGAIGVLAPALYLAVFKFTHHRPLGAATLAVMSLAAFAGVFALAWRLRVGRIPALVAVVTTAIGLTVVTFVA